MYSAHELIDLPSSVPNQLASKQILAAISDEALRELVWHSLCNAGAELYLVSDGKNCLTEAIRREGHSCDLIIADSRIDPPGAFDLTRLLRRNGIGQPIITISSEDWYLEQEESKAAGANAHLSHGAVDTQLVPTVSMLLYGNRPVYEFGRL
ncbi:MAG: response regulator [Oligoflexia bacterium]|nr:response regulator [Oligoflexia bacterium]